VLGLLGAAPVAAFAAGPALAAPATSGSVPGALRPGGELDRLVADKAARDQFSGSLLLTNRGRTVLARSYGMADLARGVKNGPGTAFALASVTKLFTATAVAQLVQQGKVAHADSVGTYVDGVPAAFAGITVHHLLTHTSGLGDYHTIPGFREESATWTSAAQVMSGVTGYVLRSEPLFAPGTGWSYSNSGYHLLGEVVAKASGMSYYDYVRAHVFAAAGMTGADFVTKPRWRTDRNVAHPYHRDEQGRWADALEEFGYIGTPAGEAFATVADMDRFARHLYRQRLLDGPATHLMLSGKVPLPRRTPPPGETPPPPPPGLAAKAFFQCYGPQGTLIGDHWNYGHGGGNTAGIATSVEFFPDTDWVLVALTNHADTPMQEIVALARALISGA
jgi:CubicO group peptidase (beta-lactamase class C family)